MTTPGPVASPAEPGLDPAAREPAVGPRPPPAHRRRRDRRHARRVAARPDPRRPRVGIILVVVGGIFLVSRIVDLTSAGSAWPLLVIVPGLALLAVVRDPAPRRARPRDPGRDHRRSSG